LVWEKSLPTGDRGAEAKKSCTEGGLGIGGTQKKGKKELGEEDGDISVPGGRGRNIRTLRWGGGSNCHLLRQGGKGEVHSERKANWREVTGGKMERKVSLKKESGQAQEGARGCARGFEAVHATKMKR